jgi:hypothetical protein
MTGFMRLCLGKLTVSIKDVEERASPKGRQSTINCTERGLLLLRVRDELRMTLHAYQVLPG